MISLKNYTKIKIFILNFILYFQKNTLFKFIRNNIKKSNSQVFQDLFVLYQMNGKKKGSFIEIGGGNGVDISNTYLLEKNYQWKGIICEPNQKLQKYILKKRKAKLVKKAIDKNCSSNIMFYENKDPYQSSLIKNKFSKSRNIKTICLNHLLECYMPKNVDYISIDTEGNELEIIKNFNFKHFDIKIFTIEHNFNKEKRLNIYNIMKRNNYKRVYKYISYMDDWYIKNN